MLKDAKPYIEASVGMGGYVTYRKQSPEEREIHREVHLQYEKQG